MHLGDWAWWHFSCLCFLYTLLSLLENLGHLTSVLGKATAAREASACWVFSCFRNPPNSDMDYRIFNVRTWSFLCVHIHTGFGHTDESAQHFCAPGRVQTSDLESDALPIEPSRHPMWFEMYAWNQHQACAWWTFKMWTHRPSLVTRSHRP